MNGKKISDSVSILNKLLKPDSELSYADRNEVLNFFVEEKIKAVKIYESSLQEKSQLILSAIKVKKEDLVKNEKHDEVARIRDLEKSYERHLQVVEEFKRNNLAASFGYSADGLNLIIAEGEYPHTIAELKKMGLHLIYFSQTLERINVK